MRVPTLCSFPTDAFRDPAPFIRRLGRRRLPAFAFGLVGTLVSLIGRIEAQDISADSGHWWTEAVEQRLARAGDNRAQWQLALASVPVVERGSLAFLLENMPERDLRTLSAKFLLENVSLATDAFSHAPWAGAVPRDVFLNDVLPYANASEQRDDWRADLRARCTPMIADCRTSTEAARRLNEQLFAAVNVRYSTARAKADQSPAESMGSGLASCTGLTILLVDACRAVGVPARLAGIPDWSDGRGNHTWAEVWGEDGRWHFVGAAEPDARGLDHAWFERDAALAQRDVPRHAIYAVSFRRTGLPFPVAWGPDSGGTDAINVTDRYTATAAGLPEDKAKAATVPTIRLMVRVHARPGGPRVAVKVQVSRAGERTSLQQGDSKDEGADTNDMLAFDLPRAQSYEIAAEKDGRTLEQTYSAGDKAQDTLDLAFEEQARTDVSAAPAEAPEIGTAVRQALTEAFAAFFAAPVDQQAKWDFAPEWQEALQRSPATVRQLAWAAFRAAPMHAGLRTDHAARLVRCKEYLSPYTVKTVGTKPPGGWGVVIAMHGGGGAPKEINDSQWQIMGRYYRDHPEVGGYLYVALRAPNDTWNGFYDDYVYPLVANLLRQLAVCEEVDLNKVDLIGYSHGGYGAFAIGPKMPDRFAAIHSSAAAPTEGETSAKTLRNTPFTFWVGEFDSAYDRRARCEEFARTLLALKGTDAEIFPYKFEEKAGSHHSDLPDRDELLEMLPCTRNPVPRELTWEQTDGVIRDFYWLCDRQPAKRQEIDGTCRDNVLTLQTAGRHGAFSVLLDERLIDFRQPVTVVLNGVRSTQTVRPDLRVLCESMARRADPDLTFSAVMDFPAVRTEEAN